ncbi:virulence factor SrfB, partial [Salmonella enterica subsp. enterica serovar Infantis]
AQRLAQYHEPISPHAGRTESCINARARPDRQPEPGVVPGRAVRVASMAIGGGTTEMAIVHSQLDDGVRANVKITPHLLCREGFILA